MSFIDNAHNSCVDRGMILVATGRSDHLIKAPGNDWAAMLDLPILGKAINGWQHYSAGGISAHIAALVAASSPNISASASRAASAAALATASASASASSSSAAFSFDAALNVFVTLQLCFIVEQFVGLSDQGFSAFFGRCHVR